MGRLKQLEVAARMRWGAFCRNATIRAGHVAAMEAVRNRARLLESDIVALKADQVTEVDGSWRRRANHQITPEHFGRDIYGDTAKRLIPIIEEIKPKTVVNIGSRVDVINCFLAQQYPNTSFVSVDIQENLTEHNSPLPTQPNWRLVSGYALDLLERGEIPADLYFWTSTSCLFTNPELRAYLTAIQGTLLINEPFAPSMQSFSLARSPEAIASNHSWIGSHNPLNPDGPVFWVHNYPAILRELGFEVRSSDVVPTPGSAKDIPRHIIVARKGG